MRSLILPFAIALSSMVVAYEDDAQMRNLENRVCTLEQFRHACGMVNPNARPEIDCGADIFVTADFLWWQSAENGLTFAILTDPGEETATLTETDFTMEDPKFQWHAGFRVGVGYNLCHDGWDLYLNWTSIKGRGGKTVTGNDTIIFQAEEALDFAQAKWKSRVNVLDLEMGRSFYTSKWLVLRPFIGLRSAWVNQSYHTDLSGTGVGHTEDFACSMSNRYWGIGPRAGLNTLWGLGCGWSIYGDAAISLVYGHFHIRQDYTDTFTGISIESTVEDDVKHTIRVGRAITDLAIGIQWDNWFCCDNYHLGLRVGYENHMFFGQNQLNNWSGFLPGGAPGVFISNLGDLTLHGFTLSARFDF